MVSRAAKPLARRIPRFLVVSGFPSAAIFLREARQIVIAGIFKALVPPDSLLGVGRRSGKSGTVTAPVSGSGFLPGVDSGGPAKPL